jgi:hypothetical protein
MVLVVLIWGPKLKAVVAHGDYAGDYLRGLVLPTGVESHLLPHFIYVGFAKIDDVSRKILGPDRRIG